MMWNTCTGIAADKMFLDASFIGINFLLWLHVLFNFWDFEWKQIGEGKSVHPSKDRIRKKRGRGECKNEMKEQPPSTTRNSWRNTIFNSSASQPAYVCLSVCVWVCVFGEAHARAPLCECGGLLGCYGNLHHCNHSDGEQGGWGHLEHCVCVC